MGATKSDPATVALKRAVNLNGTFGLKMQKLQHNLLQTCCFIIEKGVRYLKLTISSAPFIEKFIKNMHESPPLDSILHFLHIA